MLNGLNSRDTLPLPCDSLSTLMWTKQKMLQIYSTYHEFDEETAWWPLAGPLWWPGPGVPLLGIRKNLNIFLLVIKRSNLSSPTFPSCLLIYTLNQITVFSLVSDKLEMFRDAAVHNSVSTKMPGTWSQPPMSLKYFLTRTGTQQLTTSLN